MTDPIIPRRFRFKLLLDENFPPRSKLSRLNHRYSLKHIKEDLNETGLEDPQVYKIAEKLERIIVTFNDKDFRGMVGESKKTGIIGVSTNLSNEQIDKKLTAFLKKKRPCDLYRKFHYISGESG